MYKIVSKKILAPNITRFSVEAPEVARSRKPGQFVVLRAEETSERVPLTIVDMVVQHLGELVDLVTQISTIW